MAASSPGAITPRRIDPTRRTWRVLLVGGASGTGKSVLAARLARAFEVGLAQADAFRLTIEAVTSPEQQPALHACRDARAVAGLSDDKRCGLWREVAGVVSHALETVIAFHLATAAPLVLEGDTILPSLAAHPNFLGIRAGALVRSVFLVEPDEARLFRNLRDRGRGTHLQSLPEMQRDAHRAWYYGQWLAREAERCVVPVVPSGSWDTLFERTLDAIGDDAHVAVRVAQTTAIA